MVERRHPPAWYPDPHDPARLRRWDGSSWTNDVRPFPDWVRSLRLAPGPPARRPRGRPVIARRLWAASTITLTTALVLLLSLTSPYRRTVDADRVRDLEFIAAASEVCTRAKEEVLRPYDPDVDDPEELATGVELFVDELRDIDVDPGDQPRVERWLAAWDEWTEAGHRFAVAQRLGDVDRAKAISQESAAARAEVNRFASANALEPCVIGEP